MPYFFFLDPSYLRDYITVGMGQMVCNLILTANKLVGPLRIYRGFPGGSVIKNLPVNAGDARDAGLIPDLGGQPEERNGNPLVYVCLGNSMDKGAWHATIPGIAKSWT